MTRYSAILLILIGTTSIGVAQSNAIDSLWAEFDRTEDLVTKIDLLCYLAEEYWAIDPNESIEFSYKAIHHARKINYLEGIFYSYNTLGTAFEKIGEIDSSFHYFERALPMAVELGDDYALSVIKNNFGSYYIYRGNYPLALKYLQESLDGLDDPGYFIDLVPTYNNIGIIHEEQGNIEKALFYYQKVADLSTAYGDLGYANITLGYIEQLLGNNDEAISFYQKGLQVYRNTGNQLLIGETLYYLSDCYLSNKNFDQARKLLVESLGIYTDLSLTTDVIEIYMKIGEVYEQEGNEGKALELYHRAADLAIETDMTTVLVTVYEALARQYASKKAFKKAYQYQLEYQQLNDAIYNNDTKERIAQLENSYALEVSKAEREQLLAEQAEREAIVKQRTIIAIGSLIVTILVAFVAWVFYQANRQKGILNNKLESIVRERTAELERANHQLLEINHELERFTYVASHDLKEPIRNISSFITLIEHKLGQNPDEEVQDYLVFVKKNARQMYMLIDDVLAFSQITELAIEELKYLDLNAELYDVQINLSTLIQEKNARLEIPDLPKVRGKKSHFFMLFKNIIENGLKYNESDIPQLQVQYRNEEDFFRFFIKDNGIGIDPKYQEQIFEMFKRMTTRDKYEGTGIGLATCKKIINQYGGEIGVESKEGKGSTFFFTLPK